MPGYHHSVPPGRSLTAPYGTGPSFVRVPGNKLPGYDHNVPSSFVVLNYGGQARTNRIGAGGNKLRGLRRAQSSRYLHSVPTGRKKRTGRYSTISLEANAGFFSQSLGMCEYRRQRPLRSDNTEFPKELSWLSLFWLSL